MTEKFSKSIYRANASVHPWRESTISALVRAEVIHRMSEPGQHVMTGAVLLELDPQETNLQKQQILSEINRLNILMAQAELRLKRREDHAKAYSPEEIEAEKATVQNLKAQINTQTVLLQKTELDLGRLKIVAPYSGLITQVFVQIGDLANPGQSLIHILGTDLWRISASVPQKIYRQLLVGQSLSIMTHPGIVTGLIPKSIDSSMPEVQIQVSSPTDFFSGMRLILEIPFMEKQCPIPLNYIQKENRGLSIRLQNLAGEISNLSLDGETIQEWFYPFRCEPLSGHKAI